MVNVEVDVRAIRSILKYAQQIEGNAQNAFAILCCCAAALSRDIGGHNKQEFLDNCSVAWDGTPAGLLEVDQGAFDA